MDANVATTVAIYEPKPLRCPSRQNGLGEREPEQKAPISHEHRELDADRSEEARRERYKKVPQTRLERVTYGLGNRRSILLSYWGDEPIDRSGTPGHCQLEAVTVPGAAHPAG